ncbi:Uu.00g106030.m01.CDS01 [Anthostomella pinea]|uniref:Uu.00g106030.m01.CDS01 n=1 Tax=Anthostomella pinea TaxID=933095 RepID=A0AAI8YFV4_9PEZI|nr:Uu.00g106030.m01.CDS01 [Anthostomella pinea]
MADVDDELLALVGGDESSDEEAGEALSSSRPASESPDPEAKKQTTTKAKNTTPAPKSRKRRQDDSDEEEEGEASSVAASPASQQSAPMDESDSETEALQTANTNAKMEDDEDMKYPIEGIYASEAEKEEILAMPELVREQLIARRQEDSDRQRQNTLLRRLLKSQNREDDSQSAKKRKASSADLDDAQRKGSRQRTRVGGSKVGETSAGIESLRRARAEKSDRIRRREEDRERNRGQSHNHSRDHDDDGANSDSDVEWSRDSRCRPSRSRTPEVREVPLADQRDMDHIRLGRSQLTRICFYPGLEKAITGCYVRVSIGPDREIGENVYRAAVIRGLTEGKPYAMHKQNGQSFVTDQYVKVAHGKAEREWPMILFSDSSFTEAEFNRLQKTCQEEGVPLPKRPQLVAKLDEMNALMNRSWTDAEVNEKLEREKRLTRKYDSWEKSRLQNKLEEAKRWGDAARTSELQAQLEQLEALPRLAYKTSLSQTKIASPAVPSQQDRLALLNAENRRRNTEAVRKAQMMERHKARQSQMEDANESRERKSTPTGGSGASTPANGTPKLGASSKAPFLPHIQKLQLQNHQAVKDKKGVPQIHKPLVDDDIIAAMDLDIDIDID